MLSPRYAELFARRIAGETTRAIISRAGHLADLDQPGRVAQAVLTAFA